MKILIRNQTEKDWKLVETAAYRNEEELQHLLAESPGLISLADIRENSTPLILAVREFPLSIGSIDLLAFNAGGDIAIIECKLASNAEAKRKVIGQVLEYGANLWGMSYEEMDDQVRSRYGESLAELIQKHNQDPEWNEETFRNKIKAALEDGNFILVIVVDEINDALSRIVRYMNASGGQGFDFAALEMRRFHNGNSEMLIPRFFGPVHSIKTLSNITGTQWDEPTFFAELMKNHGENEVEVARQLLNWSKENVITWWGKGRTMGSFVPFFKHKNKDQQLFAVWTYGAVEIYFQWLALKPPFDKEEKRNELLRKLNEIEGVNISQDGINRRPSIPLKMLVKEEDTQRFLHVFNWVVDEIKKS